MQAIILAGGKATRMRPYTDDRPKAMVEVAGVPIIEHQMRWLEANGVDRVVVSCGYMAELIQEHLAKANGSIDLAYAIEPEPLGRGGGLKFAAAQLEDRDEPFLALNGDVIADFPVAELLEHHRFMEATATIALAPFQTTWGVADLDGGRIKGFIQSPVLPYWINGGIYALEPACVPMLPDKGDHEDTTFPQLAGEGKLSGYRIQGYWRGIDTVKDVLEATKDLTPPEAL